MARIEGVSDRQAGWLQRLAFRFCRRMFGKVVEPLRITAHNPWIFRGVGVYELASARASSAPMRLKVLASIKVAALVGCPF